LCPFRSDIRDSAAKRESEERVYLSGFVGAPVRIKMRTLMLLKFRYDPNC
jgi:hypothetical protein